MNDKDIWLGSRYQLAIELERRSDAQLQQSVNALWSVSIVNGAWRHCEEVGRANKEAVGLERSYGLITTPQGATGLVVDVIRTTDADWLVAGIPLGYLGHFYDVGYPLRWTNSPWLSEVDASLLKVAEEVFEATSYDLGLIGEEVSGFASARSIEQRAPRDAAALVSGMGIVVSNRLSTRFDQGLQFEARPSGLLWASAGKTSQR